MTSLVTLTIDLHELCLTHDARLEKMNYLQDSIFGNQFNFQGLHFKETIIEVTFNFQFVGCKELIIKCNVQLSIYIT